MLILFLAFASAGMFSCTDKKSTDGGDGPMTGNMNDPEFLAVEEGYDIVDSTALASFDGLFDILGFIDDLNPASPPGPSRFSRSAAADTCIFTHNFDDVTKWWTTTLVCWNDVGDTLTHSDSVQIFDGTTAVQYPSTATTEIRNHKHLSIDFHSNGEGTVDAFHDWVVNGAIGTLGDVLVNGEGSLNVNGVGERGFCAHSLQLSTEFVDIAINLTEYRTNDDPHCPTAGTVSHEGSASLLCTGTNGNGNWSDSWTIVTVFNDSGNTTTFENSRARWVAHSLCGEDRPGSGDDDEEDAFSSVIEGMHELNSAMFAGLHDIVVEINSRNPNPQTAPIRWNDLPSVAADTILVTYNDATDWWTVYMSATITDTSEEEITMTSVIFEDEIQFMNGDVAVQWPDSLLTSVHSIMSISGSFSSNSDDDAQFEANHDWTLVGQAMNFYYGGTFTANGNTEVPTLTAHLTDEDATCDFQASASQTFTDIMHSFEGISNDGCPWGGAISFNGQASIDCVSPRGSLSWDDAWEATAEFSNDGVMVSLSNTNSEWHFHYLCDAPARYSSNAVVAR